MVMKVIKQINNLISIILIEDMLHMEQNIKMIMIFNRNNRLNEEITHR